MGGQTPTRFHPWLEIIDCLAAMDGPACHLSTFLLNFKVPVLPPLIDILYNCSFNCLCYKCKPCLSLHWCNSQNVNGTLLFLSWFNVIRLPSFQFGSCEGPSVKRLLWIKVILVSTGLSFLNAPISTDFHLSYCKFHNFFYLFPKKF